ncbi:hypothetical protein IW140_005884 [Coemansia sp. RSA 1813]|nr:hypothetical protein EV178_005311 [Coemansia sp. RSA 1646]KAJ2210909.1 hypothetical protein EV179_005898 [Coemansia sp. RSA 487]KAJ2564066.1 hypothetical protein IW140_005884 [Coemansia sp. RSA 1813]
MKGYFGTLGAVSALLLASSSTTVVNGAGMPNVDRCVADARGQRQEQCGGLRPDSLEYNQCMAHWTDRVLQCFEDGQQSLTPKQHADRMAEEAHANTYQNEITRLSRLAMAPQQQQQQQQRQISDNNDAHYIIGDASVKLTAKQASPNERVAKMHPNGQAVDELHQEQQQHLPVSPVIKQGPVVSKQPQQTIPQQMQQNAPVVSANKPKTVVSSGKQAPVRQVTAPASSSTAVGAAVAATAVSPAAAAEEDDLTQGSDNDDMVVGEEIILPTPNAQTPSAAAAAAAATPVAVVATPAAAPITVSAKFASSIASTVAPSVNKSAAARAAPNATVKANVVVVISESTTFANRVIAATTTAEAAAVEATIAPETTATVEAEADADEISTSAHATKSPSTSVAAPKLAAAPGTVVSKIIVASSATSVLKQAEIESAETADAEPVDDSSVSAVSAEATATITAATTAPVAAATTASVTAVTIAASAIPVAPAITAATPAVLAASVATRAQAVGATSSGSLAAIVAAQTGVPQQLQPQQQLEETADDDFSSPSMLVSTTTVMLQANGLAVPSIHMTTIGKAVVPFDVNLFGTNGEPAVLPTAEATTTVATVATAADPIDKESVSPESPLVATNALETSNVEANVVDSLTSIADAGANTVSSVADTGANSVTGVVNSVLVASSKPRQTAVASASSAESATSDISQQTASEQKQLRSAKPSTLTPLGATAAAHALGIGNTGHHQSTGTAAMTTQPTPARAHMMKNKMGEASSAISGMAAVSGVALAVSFAAGILF